MYHTFNPPLARRQIKLIPILDFWFILTNNATTLPPVLLSSPHHLCLILPKQSQANHFIIIHTYYNTLYGWNTLRIKKPSFQELLPFQNQTTQPVTTQSSIHGVLNYLKMVSASLIFTTLQQQPLQFPRTIPSSTSASFYLPISLPFLFAKPSLQTPWILPISISQPFFTSQYWHIQSSLQSLSKILLLLLFSQFRLYHGSSLMISGGIEINWFAWVDLIEAKFEGDSIVDFWCFCKPLMQTPPSSAKKIGTNLL